MEPTVGALGEAKSQKHDSTDNFRVSVSLSVSSVLNIIRLRIYWIPKMIILSKDILDIKDQPFNPSSVYFSYKSLKTLQIV